MKILLLAAAAASAASASPLDRRERGGLLLCTDANATGTCKHQVYELNKCVQLEAPDGEAFSCFPRVTDCGALCTSPTSCTFGAVNFTYKHKFDLGAINWNTLIASLDCVGNS